MTLNIALLQETGVFEKINLWTIIVRRQYYGLNNIGLYLPFYEILIK